MASAFYGKQRYKDQPADVLAARAAGAAKASAAERKELEAIGPRWNKYIPDSVVPDDLRDAFAHWRHLAGTKVPRWMLNQKQCAFLMSDILELGYGGGKFGAKTDSMLQAALQYVDVPGYSALILRRTSVMLTKSKEGILTKAKEWLGVEFWNEKRSAFEFPEGSLLQFGHMEHMDDLHNYNGSRWQFVGFDQAEQFHPKQYLGMFTCLGKVKAIDWIPIRVRSTLNPQGRFKNWYRKRFIRDTPPLDENGRPVRGFIPALVQDNPFVDEKTFRMAMAQVDNVTRQQLEFGDWDIEEDGAMFQRSWFVVEEVAPRILMKCRAWDRGAGTLETSDPTVGVLGGVDENGKFWVLDVVKGKWTPHIVDSMMRKVAEADGVETLIAGQQDPGAAGKGEVLRTEAEVLAGFNYEYETVATNSRGPNGETGKGLRARPLASAAQRGDVRVLKRDWNEEFLAEMEMFVATEDNDSDNQVDAVALCYRKLMVRDGESVESVLLGGNETEDEIEALLGVSVSERMPWEVAGGNGSVFG